MEGELTKQKIDLEKLPYMYRSVCLDLMKKKNMDDTIEYYNFKLILTQRYRFHKEYIVSIISEFIDLGILSRTNRKEILKVNINQQ